MKNSRHNNYVYCAFTNINGKIINDESIIIEMLNDCVDVLKLTEI